ncbi:iron-containing redox enzyme family protein [Gordonia sp. ABSL1-1]|uniref:iron-containing redox enzyme family protein n=1 Tax=Gordonia sp. ABSL1-1 TaxID=3053923 RepID=UPI002574428B|nr:iron-containing redox enzyme family protein [Gordonia sp. ABSL1-1]MDL9935262.1 iron-containing redox enzyme family protein [Gordonia sp. ABSL1-1]
MHAALHTSPAAALLPPARGPLSAHVISVLREDSSAGRPPDPHGADPLGADIQLALYVLYELHYSGFVDVDPEYEWDPDLLALRRTLEYSMLDAVGAGVGPIAPKSTAAQEMDALSVEPIAGTGVSFHLRDAGTWQQFRDLFALRSIYHLKEADPHAWAIPRLRGQAKAALVAVEFDEFGAGRGAHIHQELFADLLAAADLRTDHLGYLDIAPEWALLPVNLMSCLGLHRALRGAAVGHLAATEITSSPGSQRLLSGLERLDAPEPCRAFYREHVEADAVHEQVMRFDVVGALIRDEPDLERDVIFGMRAFGYVEDLFDVALRQAWTNGEPIR